MLLEIKGLSKNFGALVVVRDASFSLESGQLICLLGSNGAGKTTLMRVASGLLSPDEGKFYLDGTEISLHSAQWRRQVGLVFHKTFLYQNLTGVENLRLFSQLYQCEHSDKELLQAIERVGLKSAANRLVRIYSRGMQQRLTIARALLHEPRVLILDEPFTGLDKDGSRVLMELLAEVKLQGSMVLITSHDPGATHSVTDGYMRLFRAALSEVVLVKGRSWQELEPLVYEDQVQGAAAKTPSGEGGSGGNLG